MADRTQEIRDLEDALNAGVLEVTTGTTKTRFVSPEDMRRRGVAQVACNLWGPLAMEAQLDRCLF